MTAHHQGGPIAPNLCEVLDHRGKDDRRRGFAQARLPNVSHDAYDEAAVNFDSDGILIAKILARQSLIDDDYPGAIGRVQRREIPASTNRHAHRCEVPGRHVAQLAGKYLRAARNVEPRRPSGRLQWQHGDESVGANSGNPRHALLYRHRFRSAR